VQWLPELADKFFNNLPPIAAALLVLGGLFIWQFPRLLEIGLKHYRENKRINAQIRVSMAKLDLDIRAKRAKIAARRNKQAKP
jgi:hypothetical protein